MVDKKIIEAPDLKAGLMGEIHFILLTEMGLDIWPDREFIIQGPKINIKNKTDDNGEFKHAPVGFGEYELQIGDATFNIPSIPTDDPPYPVHIPYETLPDERDAWDEPTEEEIKEEGLESEGV